MKKNKIIQNGNYNTAQIGDDNISTVKGNNQISKFIKKEKKKSFSKGLLLGLLVNCIWYIIEHFCL